MGSSENARYADNQQVSRKVGISDEYFAGFVDGEGCFYVGFGRRNDLPLKWQVITEFHLSQNPGGKNVLEAFRDRLGCGYLKPNHPKNPRDKSWVLIVKDRKDLSDKLIPFFQKHPLHSSKNADFQIFVKVLDIIYKGEHLERQGFNKVVDLVFKSPKTGLKKYSKGILLNS
jgi:hypothetical protein